MLRQAAQKIQMQLQAQAARNAQTNTNPFSLQAQASSQPISSSGAQQITGPQSFPALHSLPSSQNLKVSGSPPHQPYVPSTFQVNPGRDLTASENITQKSQEVETRSDGKGHSAYAINMNMANSERDVSMVSLQAVNKQQHHTQLPQSSFSMFGSASSYNNHAYPRPSTSSSTSLRPLNLDSHTRQVSHGQGVVSTQIRPTQSMNVHKFEQNSANEPNRQQASSLTIHSASLHNSIAWQVSANKELKSSAFQSMAYVKQEVVDQPSEPSNKSHFAYSESTLFGTAHVNQGNSALGSSSMVRTNQVSGPVPSQADQSVQMSSSILPLSGATTKTPSKKPSVGQKQPFEALGSSPPMSRKKQKTSGTFLDQSIEQLNDVTAVSRVNLREEEEQLLSDLKEESQASEATRRVVQEEEERLLLQKAPLQKKLSDISGDAEHCQMQAPDFLPYELVWTGRKSSTLNQYLFNNDEMEGNTGVDAEKDKEEGRSETLKANKEEDDKMRTTAANVAARAAVGGDDMLSKWQLMAEQARKKREGLDGASDSQLGKSAGSKTLLSLGRGSREKQESEKKGSGGMRRFGRNNALASHPKVARNISVKDVIAVLEREPQMSKSSLVHRLYERLSGDSSAE